jgi:hypothetical protein
MFNTSSIWKREAWNDKHATGTYQHGLLRGTRKGLMPSGRTGARGLTSASERDRAAPAGRSV